MTTPPALLIAGHGTRDEIRAEALRDLVQDLAARNPGLPVAGGLTGASTPPLADTVAGLVGEGVTRFAVVPLALASGRHSTDAVSDVLAQARERHPGTSYVVARPLGPHTELLRVLERRLDQALGEGARSPSDRAATTALLVGRGWPDPDAHAEVHRAARLLWDGRGLAGVEPAFVSMAAPDVASGLDRCALLGARRIVVLPYFLFPGAAPERARQQAEGWALARPDVEVVCADVMGPARELAEVVMERYREAASGADQPCRLCGRGGPQADLSATLGTDQPSRPHPEQHTHAV